MADSMGTKEASKLWGYTQQTISKWCRAGIVEGAEQDGKGCPWHIPKDTECPKQLKKESK